MCPGPLHGELGQRLRQALGEAERAVAGAADTGGVCVALDGLQHLLRPQQRDFLRWIMEYEYTYFRCDQLYKAFKEDTKIAAH